MPTPADALELLRSQSGLSIDDEGRFLHRGEPITHARTLEVLWRSLEPAPGGRWIVRIGRESAYVSVGDAQVQVHFHRRAHLPVILASELLNTPVAIPWWPGYSLRMSA